LLLTTQRLSQETLRANTAGKQALELLDRLKSTHEARLGLEVDFRRVQRELGMYKTQLDLAQKGSFLYPFDDFWLGLTTFIFKDISCTDYSGKGRKTACGS
jgi:hypothetical protein